MNGVARIELGDFPTPFRRCPRLGQTLGIEELWIKRDDLTGFSWGGNKVRTIEYLLGDAIARSADTVVACGGPTSNFAALMAVACARHGLEFHQVSYGGPPALDPAALAAGRAAGAVLRFTGTKDRTSMDGAAQTCVEKLLARGRRPYLVPRGGATAVGALGYAYAAGEFRRQLRPIGADAVTIVIPVGSGGTIAGLVAGLTHDFASQDDGGDMLEVEVLGISVSRPPGELIPAIEATASACSLGRDALRSVRLRWSLVDGRGTGFGLYDEQEAAQIDDLMNQTGLLIDTTYNGKALTWLRSAHQRPTGRVVYWHTGGALGVADRLAKGQGFQPSYHI